MIFDRFISNLFGFEFFTPALRNNKDVLWFYVVIIFREILSILLYLQDIFTARDEAQCQNRK